MHMKIIEDNMYYRYYIMLYINYLYTIYIFLVRNRVVILYFIR